MEFDVAIFQELLKQGIFAALFVALFIYVIKTSGAREVSYQNIISEVMNKHLVETKLVGETTGKVLDNIDNIDRKLSCISQKVDDVEKKVDGIDRKVEILSVHVTDKNDYGGNL